jgi:hypothetical protein
MYSKDDTYILQKAKVLNDKLIFDEPNGFLKALEDGFFLVEVPKEINLLAADTFSKNFYRPKMNNDDPNDKYRGYSKITSDFIGDPLLGFHRRKYQIEQFLLERRFWRKYYPNELVEIAEALCNLSSTIVRNVLDKVDIPKEFWEKASGGCSKGNGSYHFTFNHFRPEMDTLGLQEHQDDGFITILRSTEPGLEIHKDGKWIKLGAESEFFKINFGLTMQILTRNSAIPVNAVLHRVVQQEKKYSNEDRWSWGHFSSCQFNMDYDRGIYAYDKDKGFEFHSNARDHINQNDSDIYK